MVARFLLVALVALLTSPLHAADWLRAESDNFIVHAELEEEDLRALLQRMEDFKRLLENRLPGVTELGRKPEIFLERSERDIRQVTGRRLSGATFQNPEMSGGYIAYLQTTDPMFRDHGLYFSLSSLHADNAFFRPNPPWVRVGFPRTFATTFRTEEGAFVIGAPDVRRPDEDPISVSRLEWILSTQAIPQTDSEYGRYYEASGAAARSLLIDPQHAGLLEAYIDAYAEGRDLEEAALQLGELEPLVKAMQRLQSERRPDLRLVTLDNLKPAQIKIRPMTDAEVALIKPRMKRMRGNDIEGIARQLKRLTDRHSDSALVWFEYAAAEVARVRDAEFGGEPVFRGFGFSSGELIVSANPYSDAEAWRAVNRALELDPGLSQAIVLKAEIQLARLARSPDPADAEEYETVREWLSPLAATPESEPLAAAVVHQSYIEQGETPPPSAIEALGRAFVANSGVEEFRYAYAVSLARHGQRDVARRLLTSMLNNPQFSDAAAKALAVEAR